MSKAQYSGEKNCQPEIYEIRFRGHLHKRRVELFEDLTITNESDGTTTLIGPLTDQTALHSVLLRIRNMNLKLISVRQFKVPAEDDLRTNWEEKGGQTE